MLYQLSYFPILQNVVYYTKFTAPLASRFFLL